jgi:L-iditol 2-dehydrogenase
MIVERPAETMLAAVLYGSEDLRMERIAVPHAAAGELIVRVGAALTCGTDLKVYRRGYHAMMLKPPLVFGHELAGHVVEAGAGVTKFAVGDRVLPMNSAPCDECYFCNHGQHNLCENILFNNGAYAEYMRIPARIVEKNTLLVPSAVPLEHAALTEPLACVVHGFSESGARAGDTMAVIGAGPIGLMFMQVAHLSGLQVIAVVKREDQVAAARLFGASEVVKITDGVDTVAAVCDLTPDERGADVVIEAVATPATWESAVAMVRKGGVVNFFGGPPSGTVVALDTNRLHYGDITLKASFHHTPSASRAAFELIAGGKFKASRFITRKTTLSEVPAVFARMMTRSADNRADIKTAVLPHRNGSDGGVG